MRRVAILIAASGLLLGWSGPGGCPAVSVLDNFFLTRAEAQGQAHAVLYSVDASAFPAISTFMDVFDTSNRFVSGILPAQATVYEDGNPVQLTQLTEMVVPLQLTVAINPGPVLAVRDKLGAQRYETIVDALSTWAQAIPADTPDDMSLVTLSGPIISHASARDWLVSLQAFRPDFRESTPNLQTLQIAIQTVAVQPPRVGMKRAVLFITPHMDDPEIESLVTPLTENAVRNGVRVFVWFTDTELYTVSVSATAFENLATETGGAYFAASEAQPFPDPETFFAPLRRLYSVQYQSAAKTGGTHTVSVEVTGQAGKVRTPDQTFTLDLQPPNPIFVSPPLQVLRSPPEADPYNDKILEPAAQPLEILIEFPDGHPRTLARTVLYVDGQMVAENSAEPFNAFVWDLTGIRTSGEHKLSAEVVDSLGMRNSTIEIPVTVTVIQPPHGPAALFARYRETITIAAVALAGAVLLLIIFLGRLRTIFRRRRQARTLQGDPLTQPVAARAEPVPAAAEKTTQRLRPSPTKPPAKAATKPPTKQATEAPAYLRRMQADPLAAPGETFKPASGPTVPLTSREITFGTDPKQSSYVLADPSLDPRHARITRNENGDFFVVDAGTIGGTWVNFEPVGQEAHLLRHGDVLHFGQLVFRFELREPPAPAQPKVTKLPPKE